MVKNLNIFIIFLFTLTLYKFGTPLEINDEEEFLEELMIKPLFSEQVYTHFHFSIRKKNFIDWHHSVKFPRILAEIIQRFNVHELHASLTGGLWHYEKWGYPVTDAPSGGEIWAWFNPNTVNVDKNWIELTNTLSGLLCSSTNFIEKSNTISPEYTFRHRGVVENNANSSFLKYATLPIETVCTENLTPWRKLLPCNSKAGLGSLLNSGYIHNTRYHSLNMHIRKFCASEPCSVPDLEVQLSFSFVYDYKLLGTRNWSLQKLFGQGILHQCPMTKSSQIYVDLSINSTYNFKLTPQPDKYVSSNKGGQVNKYALYNVKPYPMSINSDFLNSYEVSLASPPILTAHQYLSGFGKEYGGFITKICNNHWANLDVVLLQNIPWFVQLYLHTMKIEINGKPSKPYHFKYIPGKNHEKSYQLEILLKLPSRSCAKIKTDFDFTFLKWQEYPPDANHGFYVGSAVVSSYLPLARNYTGLAMDKMTMYDSFNASRQGYLIEIHTENLIVTLPTPDFSMPYNVICLACTVVALAFGPFHNITTKRFILKNNVDKKILEKVKDFCLQFRKEKEE